MKYKKPSVILLILTLNAVFYVFYLIFLITERPKKLYSKPNHTSYADSLLIVTSWNTIKQGLDSILVMSELYKSRKESKLYSSDYISSSWEVILDSSVFQQQENMSDLFNNINTFLNPKVLEGGTRNVPLEIDFFVEGYKGLGEVFSYYSSRYTKLTSKNNIKKVMAKIAKQREYEKYAHTAWREINFYDSLNVVMQKLKQDLKVFPDDEGYHTYLGGYKYTMGFNFYHHKLFKLVFISKPYDAGLWGILRGDWENLYSIASKKFGRTWGSGLPNSWNIDRGFMVFTHIWLFTNKTVEIAIQKNINSSYNAVLIISDTVLSEKYSAEQDSLKATSTRRAASDF